MWPNSYQTEDFVIFTVKIFKGKFVFCGVLFTLKNHQLLKLNGNSHSVRETKEQRKCLIT